MISYCSDFNREIFFLKTITKFESNSPSGHKKPQQSPLKLLGIKKSIVFKLIIFYKRTQKIALKPLRKQHSSADMSPEELDVTVFTQ